MITGYLFAGYTVVVPDYEGPELEWTIGRQSGYAALDGIRAAETVLGLPRSTPVGLLGYSGGSVPTQWGAEVAADYGSLLDVPAVVAAIDDNIMGTAGIPRVPLLLAVGQADAVGDTIMVTGDVEALAHEYCEHGVAVSWSRYPGPTHGAAYMPFQAESAMFFTDRFTGAAPRNDCGAVGAGNDLTPTPIPGS